MENMTKFSFFGDKGIFITFGKEITQAGSQTAFSFSQLLEQEKMEGVVEAQPSYNSVLVYYDPLKIKADLLIKRMQNIVQFCDDIALPSPQVYEIPTLYGGEYGPDLGDVAEYNGITPEEAIRIHTKEPLWVYRMGLNLHNLVPEKLITPRRKVPRLRVPAGAVGIGNKQTGPYVVEAPAGWNIIGRTPLKLYDPKRNPPFLFEIGNYVRYRSIDRKEFMAIESGLLPSEQIPG